MKIDEAVSKLIERLRSVKWEVADDGDRTPDDPTHKCVFVDMRPDDFRALLREAADALEAARGGWAGGGGCLTGRIPTLPGPAAGWRPETDVSDIKFPDER